MAKNAQKSARAFYTHSSTFHLFWGCLPASCHHPAPIVLKLVTLILKRIKSELLLRSDRSTDIKTGLNIKEALKWLFQARQMFGCSVIFLKP